MERNFIKFLALSPSPGLVSVVGSLISMGMRRVRDDDVLGDVTNDVLLVDVTDDVVSMLNVYRRICSHVDSISSI